MNNIEYIKKELKKDITTATKQIDKLYKEVRELEIKLPNDCTGYIDEFGEKCENPDMKYDILTNYYHQIGYYECMRVNAKNILAILKMNDQQVDDMILENKRIDEENKKHFQDVLDYIKNKHKNI